MFGEVVVVNLDRFNVAVRAIQLFKWAITQFPQQIIKSFRLKVVATAAKIFDWAATQSLGQHVKSFQFYIVVIEVQPKKVVRL